MLLTLCFSGHVWTCFVFMFPQIAFYIIMHVFSSCLPIYHLCIQCQEVRIKYEVPWHWRVVSYNMVWDSNLGLLQEQVMLLTAELSLLLVCCGQRSNLGCPACLVSFKKATPQPQLLAKGFIWWVKSYYLYNSSGKHKSKC